MNVENDDRGKKNKNNKKESFWCVEKNQNHINTNKNHASDSSFQTWSFAFLVYFKFNKYQ